MIDISTWITGWELGSRVYDFAVRQSAPLNRPGYLREYVSSLNNAIDILQSLHALDHDGLKVCIVELLKSTALVVQAYHGENEKVRILSNYMICEPATEATVKESRFCDDRRRADTFEGFLRLVAWSDGEDRSLPRGVLLPVEFPGPTDKQLHHLIGAPRAYQSAVPQIINDTLHYDLLTDCPIDHIRVAQQEHFERHKDVLRSFVSFPLNLPTLEGRELSVLSRAVVNVQSNQPLAFGWAESNQRKLVLLMAPFMQVIAFSIAWLHSEAVKTA